MILLGFATIFLSGLLLGTLADKLHLPKLVGMIAAGILIGPHCLNLISTDLLDLSSELRRFALVIILTRAGLSLDINDLKKVGRSAVMMCFVPALFEICATTFIAPVFFDISHTEAALLGAVLGAVSPAVVVPRMLKLMDEGYGVKKSIPQLILTGASADDVFVIVVFTSLMSICQGGNISPISIINIPVSIILGVLAGIIIGYVLNLFYNKFKTDTVTKTIILLSISFLLLSIEDHMTGNITMSSLLAIMTSGITLRKLDINISKSIASNYNQLWAAGEIILFVLVGAEVNIKYALNFGALAVLVVIFAVIFRMLGVKICVTGTDMNFKEKIFCMLAYTPKATVQAAIGALPLAAGLPCGELILTVAVLAILITGPFGAICIDKTYKMLLTK